MGLEPEARAMATVTHAAITQVYGIESWRGRPFLVVEHLAGGTLADRLRQEPLPAAEAVLGITLIRDNRVVLNRTIPSGIGCEGGTARQGTPAL